MLSTQSAQALWDKTLEEQIRPELSLVSYQTWFQNIEAEFSGEHDLVLLVPDEIARGQVTKYLKLIETALQIVAQRRFTVKIILRSRGFKQMEEERLKLRDPEPQSGINPNYTFERFIVGESNRFAHAACVAASSLEDIGYNLLFLYGGSGLGKTHLLQAIGNEVLQHDPTKKVIYVTTERFVNEFIQCIPKKNGFDEFRNHYRQVDLLLLDDIQFLEGKEKMQEEFFHTFNTLYELGKTIVITCDKPAQSLATLEDRLKTRMAMGITCDITPPDYETRMAILIQLMNQKKLQLESNVLDFIARNITDNVRDLEGAFRTIDAYSRLGNYLDLETVQKALKDMIKTSGPSQIDIDLIQEIVANYFNISISDLKSKKRDQTVIVPRHLAMYLCRQMTSATFEEIGQHFGGRHHATAMHAYKNIQEDLTNNHELQKNLDQMLKRIQS